MVPLIGRGAEIATFERLLAEVTDRRPAAVVLDGDAGVGKSRLLSEFAAKADAAGAVVLSGGCVELTSGSIPYGPLVEALLRLVRERGEEDARRLAGPAWTELGDLISDFTTGEPSSPAAGAQVRVFGAVSRLLDHIGGHRPLVLIFEDVQWADTATLDLIAYLAFTKSDQRLLLLCSYRSRLDPGHPLRTRLAEPEFTRRTHRLSLAPFTSQELRAFVAASTGEDVSPERTDRYYELSEGNPYFTEQLIAADGAAGGDLTIPEGLNDLMQTRLERLGPEAAKVAQVVAVAGRRVGDALLARVVGLAEPELDAGLAECLRHGILVEDRVDESYRFHHAMLRAVAYDSVLTRERKRLHGALADALAEEVGENPHVLAELAYHWYAADRVPEAVRAAIGAGDRAMRLRAFPEAETQYRRALGLWPRLSAGDPVVTRTRVLTAAADAARWAGHLRAAIGWAEEAVESLSPGSDPALRGELNERLGSYRWEAGFEAEAVAAYREAVELLAGAPASAAGSRAHSALATAEVKRGNYTAALAVARLAEQEAAAAQAVAEIGRAKNSTGLALTLLGRPDEGIAELREAVRVAREADHLEDLLRAYGNLGVCLERAGRVVEAGEAFLEGLEKGKELGLLGTRQAALLTNNACATLFSAGRWAEAGDLVDEALRSYPARETAFHRLTRAEIDLACGRFDEASRLLESIRDHPSTQPRFLSPLYRCIAELAAGRGDTAVALDTVHRGIDAVAGSEDRMLVLQLCACGLKIAADAAEGDAGAHAVMERAPVLIDLARTAAEGADDVESAALAALCRAEESRLAGADAAGAWAESASRWRALERPYALAYALTRLASAVALEGDRDDAWGFAIEAAEIVQRLGAVPLHGAVRQVIRHHRLARRTGPARRLPLGLTQRELEVLRDVARGLTNQQIATKQSVVKGTVGTHLSNAYEKLGVSSRLQAAAKLREAGLLDEL